ncbi:MAG: hypothetical protein LBE18_10845 [Planctomycetaceae bacterium]|jgi:hypothetical protein|nr:hypothetical protein [Planctomycetaceae bacterium]
MKIWNTVFIVLIIILAVFTWIYGGKALLIRREWSTSIQKLQKQIDTNKTKLQAVIDGSNPDDPRDLDTVREFSAMRLSELVNKLDVMAEDRGNAWFGCKPSNLKEDGASVMPQQLGEDKPATPDNVLKPLKLVTVSVEISSPVDWNNVEEVIPPNKLGGILYVFDEGKDGNGENGAFIGIFTLNKVPEKTDKAYTAELKSAIELNDYEIKVINNSMQSLWAVYSSLPRDRYDDIFNRIKKDDLERIVPAEIRADLTNAQRNLVDFDVALSAAYLKNTQLKNKRETLKRNVDDLKVSIGNINYETKEINFAIELENKRIALMNDQITAVQRVLDGYNDVIERIKDSIIKTQKQNDWYAAKIAEYHLKSLQTIEKKAEAAAKKIE